MDFIKRELTKNTRKSGEFVKKNNSLYFPPSSLYFFILILCAELSDTSEINLQKHTSIKDSKTSNIEGMIQLVSSP